MKKDLKGRKKEDSAVFEVEDQALLYVKRSIIYNSSSCERDLYYATASEMRIHIWRREVTQDAMVEMADYRASGDSACQHKGLKNVMTNIVGVPQAVTLYRKRET